MSDCTIDFRTSIYIYLYKTNNFTFFLSKSNVPSKIRRKSFYLSIDRHFSLKSTLSRTSSTNHMSFSFSTKTVTLDRAQRF